MIPFRCLVQAEQISSEQKDRLAARLTQLSNDVTGESTEAAPVVWVDVADRFGFTAGGPSQSSVVVSVVPDDTPQETRVDLMRGICDAWSDVTGCSVNDVVATTVNLSFATQAES